MQRIYEALLQEQLQQHRQMAFIAGPRQTGKTTLAQALAAGYSQANYYNWDKKTDRSLIVSGPDAIAAHSGLLQLQATLPLLIFDEIHKYPKWKNFLKGFFDTYQTQCKIIVTGSAQLNLYRRGGDSLMGRYFLYRVHPLSVREIVSPQVNELINGPKNISDENWKKLWNFGGYPEPFIKASSTFYQLWAMRREEQVLREDVRDLSKTQDLAGLEALATILKYQSTQLVNYTNLAKQIGVAQTTIKRWIGLLNSLYYSFTINPWFKNVNRSLRKEPKIYLWNWAEVHETGNRAENFVACHLLKAVHFWTDSGLGKFNLHFIRDTSKQEVDFLVTRQDKPWFLVEVKNSNNRGITKALQKFHQELKTEHAFQVCMDLDYVEADCFAQKSPLIVPARTFLSQLV